MKAIFMLMVLTLSACSPNSAEPIPPPATPPVVENPKNPETPEVGSDMKVTIGNQVFNVTLAENATTTAFRRMLPLTVDMSDFNANEKLCYLSDNLPTAASSVGTIQTGDLMLFGSNCLVLFYETFRSSYSYTRIGRIDDAAGLAAAVGRGSVRVKFEITK